MQNKKSRYFSRILFTFLFYLMNFYELIIIHDLFKMFYHIKWCWYHLKVTCQGSLMEQDMLTFPEHLSSQPVFIGILVAQSLVFGVAFCRSLFVLLFVLFLFCHYVVCTSVYGFLLQLWYLPTFPASLFLKKKEIFKHFTNTWFKIKFRTN